MPPIISRGFRGRRSDGPADRLPPGQYLTPDFPVLSAGPTPHTPLDRWDFSIVGEVDEPRGWSWEEFRSLPSEDVTADESAAAEYEHALACRCRRHLERIHGSDSTTSPLSASRGVTMPRRWVSGTYGRPSACE